MPSPGPTSILLTERETIAPLPTGPPASGRGRPGRRAGLRVDRDLVDDPPRDEVLQHPQQVAGVDAVHRRAGADDRVQAEDRLVRVLVLEPVDQVDLGPDARRCPAGASAIASMMNSVEPSRRPPRPPPAGTRVDDHVDVREGRAAGAICSTPKRAWTSSTLPQDQRRVAERLRRVARRAAGTGPRRPSCPCGDALATPVLRPRCSSGKKQTSRPARRPSRRRAARWTRCRRSRRCAAERLQGGGRVHVGDRDDPVDPRRQRVPAGLDVRALAMSAIEQPASRFGRITSGRGRSGCRRSRP
jgi:hypothetical protein